MLPVFVCLFYKVCMRKTIPAHSYSDKPSSAKPNCPCQDCELRKDLQHCFIESWHVVIIIVPVLTIIKCHFFSMTSNEKIMIQTVVSLRFMLCHLKGTQLFPAIILLKVMLSSISKGSRGCCRYILAINLL